MEGAARHRRTAANGLHRCGLSRGRAGASRRASGCRAGSARQDTEALPLRCPKSRSRFSIIFSRLLPYLSATQALRAVILQYPGRGPASRRGGAPAPAPPVAGSGTPGRARGPGPPGSRWRPARLPPCAAAGHGSHTLRSRASRRGHGGRWRLARLPPPSPPCTAAGAAPRRDRCGRPRRAVCIPRPLVTTRRRWSRRGVARASGAAGSYGSEQRRGVGPRGDIRGGVRGRVAACCGRCGECFRCCGWLLRMADYDVAAVVDDAAVAEQRRR